MRNNLVALNAAHLRPAKGSNFRGVAEFEGFGRLGEWLDDSHTSRRLNIDIPRDAAFYVYSYLTPIAFHDGEQWHALPFDYSQSTKRHAKMLWTAIYGD